MESSYIEMLRHDLTKDILSACKKDTTATSLPKLGKFMNALMNDVGTMLDNGHGESSISLLFAYASSKLPSESNSRLDDVCYLTLHNIEEACIELTIETEFLANSRSIFVDKHRNSMGISRKWDGDEILRKSGL
jgi:hypothetical protein